MKLETVLFKLREAAAAAENDPELGHLMADQALLEFINNVKVEAAYNEILKGYNL